MFIMGWLAQRYRDHLYPTFCGRALFYCLLYAVVSLVSARFALYPLIGQPSNVMPIINYLALCALVMSFAYTGETLADRLLHRNDISYGLYIYHMPAFNALLVAGWGGVPAAVAAAGTAIILAVGSWFLIEKPALSKREKPLYAHSETGAKG